MPAHDHHTHSHRVEISDLLDFVNMADPTHPDERPEDEAMLVWLIGRGLVHPARQLADSGDTASRAHRLRAALRALFAATTEQHAPEADALDEINRALRAVAPIELTANPDGLAVGHRHLGDPVDDALGRLAQVVVRVVANGEIRRLRLCANARCRTAFHDTSHAGTRRWCDMRVCGNRAKAERHRARARRALTSAARPWRPNRSPGSRT